MFEGMTRLRALAPTRWALGFLLGGFMINAALSSSAPAELISTTAMPQGMPAADAPPGFISFCYRYNDQCEPSGNDASPVHLDSKTQHLLESVNITVNHAIQPGGTDRQRYGRAVFWNIPTDGIGDCEEVSLTKRKQLIQAGLSERALRLAIVITRRDNRHMVLTVVTDRGDLILDNLSDVLTAWSDTDYRWLERQDGGGELGWITFTNLTSG
jgi:predicted transglutaminase-like cysteine proteinase